MSSSSNRDSLLTFTLFPAVAVLLGWGLRGYIGGGPFAAMIPGAYVALCLSLLFRHDVKTAATVAMFGAIGIGYGGDMTYGQTLGFVRQPDTVYWGLLGVTIKGAIWGLLGGAVFAVGLTRRDYANRSLIIAFGITVIAFYLGWKLINEPKLIYFSNREDRPREESWAGLLFAAIAILAYLRTQATGSRSAIPLRFALWGALGGGLGFGGGAVWMAIGPQLPVNQDWMSWWKYMEFTFGFLLGGSLGLAAYRNRTELADMRVDDADDTRSWLPVAALAGVMLLVFVVLPLIVARGEPLGESSIGLVSFLWKDFVRLAQSYILFGAVCIVIALRSSAAAWQIAITITYFHTILDLIRDMIGETPPLGFSLPGTAAVLIIVGSTIAIGAAAWRLSLGTQPVRNLYLLLLGACYAVATARTFFRKPILFPADGEDGGLSLMLSKDPAELVVYAIFTVSAIITLWFILRRSRSEHQTGVS